ncbi:MAG: sporulation initiation factor Spo0A C-terminal domain-containing protein [Oscillospiraceae bacterium]|nr:sporulation initiation factor Spo0A C-terminal domain-containing protein [Oscillospiraceae bacterium]
MEQHADIFIFDFQEKEYLKTAQLLSRFGCNTYYFTEKALDIFCEINKGSPKIIVADCDVFSVTPTLQELAAVWLKMPAAPVIVFLTYYPSSCREKLADFVYNKNVFFLRKPLFADDFRMILDSCDFPVSDSHSKSKSERITQNERLATSLVRGFGVPIHSKGYRYLRDAVLIVLEDKNMPDGITKELYPKIAKMSCTSPTKAERAIRNAIELAWEKQDFIKNNPEHKPFELGNYRLTEKPTNAELIALISDYVVYGWGEEDNNSGENVGDTIHH